MAEEGWWEMGGAHRGMVLAAVQWNFERQSQDRRKNDGAQPDDVRVAPRRDGGWPVFTLTPSTESK